MTPDVREHVDIAKFSTFAMGSKVRWFAEAHAASDIPRLLEETRRLNATVHILGEGSNTVFATSDESLPYFVIKMNNTGIEVIAEDDDQVIVNVQAGHNWDAFVRYTVERGLSGAESLSAIPGSVGAAPVQNIGAYGQEVCNIIDEVRVFDTTENKLASIANADCGFSYRDSIFKSAEKGRYIICSVVFRLSKAAPAQPTYPDVIKYFESHSITDSSLSQIRDAVIDIRARKLPDPAKEPNVGSYFKNAIVEDSVANRLLETYPDMPTYAQPNGMTKIPTAWLIDKVGLKGKSFGHIRIHEKHALVLIHDKSGSFADLQSAEQFIILTVYDIFGIRVEREPNIVC